MTFRVYQFEVEGSFWWGWYVATYVDGALVGRVPFTFKRQARRHRDALRSRHHESYPE